MIDDFVTAKALLDKAQAFADALIVPDPFDSSATVVGARLCIQGAAFTPVTTETYLKETFLSNDTDPLGLAADSSDRQDSIYQLDIYTPKDNGKFSGLAISNDIKAEFKRAGFIPNGARQTIQVSNVSAAMLPANKTHNMVSLSIDLVVLACNG
jgi:hypothetical protein